MTIAQDPPTLYEYAFIHILTKTLAFCRRCCQDSARLLAGLCSNNPHLWLDPAIRTVRLPSRPTGVAQPWQLTTTIS